MFFFPILSQVTCRRRAEEGEVTTDGLDECSVESSVVYCAGGLLGSGRLLARYLARMLEVYCGRETENDTQKNT